MNRKFVVCNCRLCKNSASSLTLAVSSFAAFSVTHVPTPFLLTKERFICQAPKLSPFLFRWNRFVTLESSIKNRKDKLEKLGLNGTTPRSTAGFITSGYALFDNAIKLNDVKTALSKYGYTEGKLTSERAKTWTS